MDFGNYYWFNVSRSAQIKTIQEYLYKKSIPFHGVYYFF
jgi:hypothetical protein